jgi:hypothetical protein
MMDTGSAIAALLVLFITGGYFLSIIFRGLATPISSPREHQEHYVGSTWVYAAGGDGGGVGFDGGDCGGGGDGGC